jgi:hypothetical protein
MHKLIVGGLALVLSAGALPALAGDLLYRAEPDSLTEALDGQPYWAAQAQCAGLFGGAAQYLTVQGGGTAADEAKTSALAFADDAIAQLRKDRGLTKAQAIEVITPAVLKAREDGERLISQDNSPRSAWNFARSSCLDVADSYRTQASW